MKLRLRTKLSILILFGLSLVGCTGGDDSADTNKDNSSNGVCAKLTNACSGTGTDPINDCSGSLQTAKQNNCGTEYKNWVQCIPQTNCDPASCQGKKSTYQQCMGNTGGTDADAGSSDSGSSTDTIDTTDSGGETTSGGICTDLNNACAPYNADPAPNCSQSLQKAKSDGCDTEYTNWLQCIVDINCDPASCQDKKSTYDQCTSSSTDICTKLNNACAPYNADPAPNCSQSLQTAKNEGCETEYTSWLQCIVDINCDPASCQDKKSTYDTCAGN